MAMKGWRRIGIIVSVIWFLGFGVFLWNQYVEDAGGRLRTRPKDLFSNWTIQRRLLAGECSQLRGAE
jgi:hypothetical protein